MRETGHAYHDDTGEEDEQIGILGIAITTAFVLLLAASMVNGFLALYNLHSEVGSHMNLAAGAGSPSEMANQLEQAQEGLDDIGYSGGQYAYFWKTPATNTEVQRDILQSYIDRAEMAANAENNTHQSAVFMDLRRGLTGTGESDSGWGIDTFSEWGHDSLFNFFSYWTTMFLPITVMVVGILAFVNVCQIEEYVGWAE